MGRGKGGAQEIEEWKGGEEMEGGTGESGEVGSREEMGRGIALMLHRLSGETCCSMVFIYQHRNGDL